MHCILMCIYTVYFALKLILLYSYSTIAEDMFHTVEHGFFIPTFYTSFNDLIVILLC